MVESILRFAKRTRAVEAGFLAAGITVTVVALAQAIAILVSWIAA